MHYFVVRRPLRLLVFIKFVISTHKPFGSIGASEFIESREISFKRRVGLALKINRQFSVVGNIWMRQAH